MPDLPGLPGQRGRYLKLRCTDTAPGLSLQKLAEKRRQRLTTHRPSGLKSLVNMLDQLQVPVTSHQLELKRKIETKFLPALEQKSDSLFDSWGILRVVPLTAQHQEGRHQHLFRRHRWMAPVDFNLDNRAMDTVSCSDVSFFFLHLLSRVF